MFNSTSSDSNSTIVTSLNERALQLFYRPPVFPSPSFEEIKISSKYNPPESPPSIDALRPFYFMRLLSESMQKGGYISPSLFIPKQIWTQIDVKISQSTHKVAFCDSLCEHLKKLSQADTSKPKAWLQDMDNFLANAEILQDTLSKHVFDAKIVHFGSRRDSGFGKIFRAITKGVALVSSSSSSSKSEEGYLPGKVLNTFSHADFLHGWIEEHFNKSKQEGQQLEAEITQRLEGISCYLYVVLVSLVMKDMSLLLDRYMKKTGESFVLLFPDDYNYKY